MGFTQHLRARGEDGLAALLVLRPELAAPSMSGSSLLVALNALRLRRLRLPRSVPAVEEAAADVSGAR